MPERCAEVVTPSEPDEWDIIAQQSKKPVQKETPKEPDVNLSYCVAQFCHFYPNEFQNGQIGWRRFWLLYWQIYRISAIHRWNMAQSTMIGSGLYQVNEQGHKQLSEAMNRDFRIASGQED